MVVGIFCTPNSLCLYICYCSASLRNQGQCFCVAIHGILILWGYTWPIPPAPHNTVTVCVLTALLRILPLSPRPTCLTSCSGWMSSVISASSPLPEAANDPLPLEPSQTGSWMSLDPMQLEWTEISRLSMTENNREAKGSIHDLSTVAILWIGSNPVDNRVEVSIQEVNCTGLRSIPFKFRT